MELKKNSLRAFRPWHGERGSVAAPVAMSSVAGVVCGFLLVAGPLRPRNHQVEDAPQVASRRVIVRRRRPVARRVARPAAPVASSERLVGEELPDALPDSNPGRGSVVQRAGAALAGGVRGRNSARPEAEADAGASPDAAAIPKPAPQGPPVEERFAEELSTIAKSSSFKKVGKAATLMLKEGGDAQDLALVAMATRRGEWLAKLHKGNDKRFEKLKKYRSKLDEVRAAALERIFDQKVYYKKPPHQVFGQKEVDDLVHPVRQLWAARASLPRKTANGRIGAWLTRLDALANKYKKGSMPSLSVDEIQMLILAKGPLTLQQFANSMEELHLRFRDKQVKAWNDKKVPAGEVKRCFTSLNDYREMMGKPRVAYDSRLQGAAQAHSEDMLRVPFFAHQSPIAGKASPSDRCRKAGWGQEPTKDQTFFETPFPIVLNPHPQHPAGGGIGENIAMGMNTGREAFQGWYRSPPHHRNMLGRWDVVGIGNAGNKWTQNFGGLGRSCSGR